LWVVTPPVAALIRLETEIAARPVPAHIWEAHERLREARVLVSWLRADLGLSAEEQPTDAELERSQALFAQALDEFEGLGGERVLATPDRHEDLYATGWEGYEL